MKPNFLVNTLGVMVLVVGMMDAALKPAYGISFTPPPDNSAPRSGSGGASRGGFIPPPDNSAPRSGSGGASRNGFIPPPDNSAPRSGSGGASRNGFTPPPNQPAPRYAAGGASRTNLYGSNLALAAQPLAMMALTPESFYGTTLSAHPTILTYLPASNAQEAIFSLKDEEKNLHYRMVIPVSGQAGIITVQLPEDAPPLEVGKDYQWYITLKLDGNLTPGSPFVDGWIQRIEPDAALAQALAQGTALEDAAVLAERGIWYDTAAIFAELRREQPTSEAIAQEWEELLNSVGLTEMVAAPMTAVLPR
ncbi:DUF928 domain-containing protein [Oculatella sp. LEGE 06141]|uniref:DUF928 domain-containing protein n=1 Tax=Oculatella sp. LEGE 06141 TaxID=1828648 RepID=UPI00187F544D|nr:DUF928 domain-containing protein [Oculatella sp. LEGE 06141]MBE9181162.1 DUF928 domain-containing protein [Oculatella sp. LEGE 06141]